MYRENRLIALPFRGLENVQRVLKIMTPSVGQPSIDENEPCHACFHRELGSSAPIEKPSQRRGDFGKIDARIAAQHSAHLIELFVNGQGEVNKQPLAPRELASATSATTQPLVAYSVTQFLGCFERNFK
jgi:hypothetical protein